MPQIDGGVVAAGGPRYTRFRLSPSSHYHGQPILIGLASLGVRHTADGLAIGRAAQGVSFDWLFRPGRRCLLQIFW